MARRPARRRTRTSYARAPSRRAPPRRSRARPSRSTGGRAQKIILQFQGAPQGGPMIDPTGAAGTRLVMPGAAMPRRARF